MVPASVTRSRAGVTRNAVWSQPLCATSCTTWKATHASVESIASMVTSLQEGSQTLEPEHDRAAPEICVRLSK